jgi:hypothetical protein
MSLFQQHLPPSTTTNRLTYDPSSFNPVIAPAQKPTPGTAEEAGVSASKVNQMADNEKQHGSSEAGEESELDPSYVRHPQEGPYIKHRGLSICTSLGEGVLFYGLDCR